MASPLHYLTVQDILWISLQATKKVHHFNYARLEEATYYQYAYGESNSLLPQATRFATGFLKLHPLDEGNEVTGFIGLLAFLEVNGATVDLSDEDAFEWYRSIVSKRKSAGDALRSVVLHMDVEEAFEDEELEHDAHDPHPPDVRSAIQGIMERFPNTVAALAAKAPASVA